MSSETWIDTLMRPLAALEPLPEGLYRRVYDAISSGGALRGGQLVRAVMDALCAYPPAIRAFGPDRPELSSQIVADMERLCPGELPTSDRLGAFQMVRQALEMWEAYADDRATEIARLKDALRPFADCDARAMARNTNPEHQFIYSTRDKEGELNGISLQHVLDARALLEDLEKKNA